MYTGFKEEASKKGKDWRCENIRSNRLKYPMSLFDKYFEVKPDNHTIQDSAIPQPTTVEKLSIFPVYVPQRNTFFILRSSHVIG